MNYNRKKLVILCGLVLLSMIAVSWYSPGDGDRNLKVLPKDISSDSLSAVMDSFVSALNVNCAFCHAPKDRLQPRKLDYASDANHIKEITRSMMRMTNDMNTKYMKTLRQGEVQLVSCNTCHRGHPVPEVK